MEKNGLSKIAKFTLKPLLNPLLSLIDEFVLPKPHMVPSIYINDSNFYEYLGHPKSKFQNAIKNSRVEIGVYLLYTKFSIFQCRFDTKFFRIFGPVFTVKFKIYHLNSTNLFTGLGFSTYPFLW